MFDKLDSANRLNDSGNFPYLRSHPLTVERLAEARSRVLLTQASQRVESAPPLLHALMQARSRVLMNTDSQVLRRLQEPLASSGTPLRKERAAQLYAGALASLQLREPALARRATDELVLLLQQTPADAVREPLAERQAQFLLAQVQMAQGEPQAAVATLAKLPGAQLAAAETGPSRAVLMLSAQAALQAARAAGSAAATAGSPVQAALRESTESLQTWLTEHKRDVAAWALLAATAEAAGMRLRSLRAHAEARAAEGDLTGAIDRFRAAQGAARGAGPGPDFIEASIIDSRLRELMAQRRALFLEASGRRAPQDRDREREPAPQ
jgi:beta-barrel assembly-enhancing protease